MGNLSTMRTPMNDRTGGCSSVYEGCRCRLRYMHQGDHECAHCSDSWNGRERVFWDD